MFLLLNNADFVHPNVPCIIKNAVLSNASGATLPLTLTLDEIIQRVGLDAKLTVDVTPDGNGDCIRSVLETNNEKNTKKTQRRMFVKPHEKRMGIGQFRDLLRRGQEVCDDRTDTDAVDSNGLELFPLQCHSNRDDSNDRENLYGEDMRPPVVYYSRQVSISLKASLKSGM